MSELYPLPPSIVINHDSPWYQWIIDLIENAVAGVSSPTVNADDFDSVQAAIDFAETVDGLTFVSLNGKSHTVTTPVRIKNNVVLFNGKIVYNTAQAGEAIVYIGNPLGGDLTRPAGAIGVYVSTNSQAVGVVGFRMDTLVRSCFFKDCFASMTYTLDGGGIDTLNHVGFEIVSTTTADATGGGVGAYQNLIEGCTALSTWAGFRIYTRGLRAGAIADAQANGNQIKSCRAYGCCHSAVVLGAGAQENTVDVRADTFDVSNSQSVLVVEIDGARYNNITVWEEVGTVAAGEQHTVKYLASDALYNYIEYHTQNSGTGGINVDDEIFTIDGIVSKNIHKMVGMGQLSSNGGEVVNVHHYTSTVLGNPIVQEIRDK